MQEVEYCSDVVNIHTIEYCLTTLIVHLSHSQRWQVTVELWARYFHSVPRIIKGTAEIDIIDADGIIRQSHLKDALFVPTFKQNTFSVQAATENGASIDFKPESAELVREVQNLASERQGSCTTWPAYCNTHFMSGMKFGVITIQVTLLKWRSWQEVWKSLTKGNLDWIGFV